MIIVAQKKESLEKVKVTYIGHGIYQDYFNPTIKYCVDSLIIPKQFDFSLN